MYTHTDFVSASRIVVLAGNMFLLLCLVDLQLMAKKQINDSCVIFRSSYKGYL